MTNRDRLIEITEKSFAEQYEKRGLLTASHTVDDFLANGVIVPVRCKDCKYYYCVDNKTRLCTNKNNLTLKTALTISREHYCSYGELKELGK